jgi:hypothetical protein
MEEGAQIAVRKSIAKCRSTEPLPGRLMKRALLLSSSEHVAPLLLGKLLVTAPHGGSAPMAGESWKWKPTLARITRSPTPPHTRIAG